MMHGQKNITAAISWPATH